MTVISYDDYKKKNKKRLQEEHQAWVKQVAPIHEAQIEQQRKKQNATFGQIWLGGMAGFFGNATESFLNTYEGASDKIRYATANILDVFGADNKAEKIRAKAKENDVASLVKSFKHVVQGDYSGSLSDEEIELKDYANTYGQLDDTKGGRLLKGTASGLGSTLGFASMTGYLGGASEGINATSKLGKLTKGAIDLAPIYTSSSGSAISEAYSQGASNWEATKYGVLSGGIEAGTEAMFGGLGATADALGLSGRLGLGNGALDDKIVKGLTKKFQSTIARNLVDLGVRSTGEGVEELVSGLLTPLAKKITYMSNEELKDLYKDENLLEDFVTGTLSSLLSQAPSNIIATTTGTDVTTGLSKNERKVLDEIIKTKINQEIDNQNMNNEEKIGKLTNKEELGIRNEIEKQALDGSLDVNDIKEALKNSNLKIDSNNDVLLAPYKDIINKTSDFATTNEDLQIDQTRLNKDAKIEDIQERVSQLEKDFKNELVNVNNTEQAHKLFSEMKNIIEATGEKVRLTSYKQLEADGQVKLLTDKNGNPILDGKGNQQYTDLNGNLIGINGFRTNNNEIFLNADGDVSRALESTLGHEIGEYLKANNTEGYKLLKELAIEVGRNDGTLTKETFDALKSAYGEQGEGAEFRTDSYLDEYVNDKIGELFDPNNTNLINEIGKKPSVIRNIIDTIKYLLKKISTKTKEGKKLLEAQHNLEKMLKQTINETGVSETKTTQQEKQTKKVEKKKETSKKENIVKEVEEKTPIKEKAKEKPTKFKEVTDEDLFNVDIKEVENQIDKQNYKLNEDIDTQDSPIGNYWDIDDTYFKLKDGNTLWIETPTEYGKYKNGKTNYQDEIHNKIEMFIEDADGNIIDEYTLTNEKGEFTREDILNGIKHLTYDDSNKVADGQLDIFDNVHRNDGHKYSLAKHYGDLGKGNDTYYTNMSGSRSTGHFGTGTYFVGEEYQTGESSSYANRPVNKVEFDDYNLYKPKTDSEGFTLHDGLRAINSKIIFNENEMDSIRTTLENYQNELTEESTQKLLKELDRWGYDVENIKNDFENGWDTRAEKDLVEMAEDILDDYDSKIRDYSHMVDSLLENTDLTREDIWKAFRKARDTMFDYNDKGYKYGQYPTAKVDSLSTVFMKSLGFNGIDVRGLDSLDNTTYGSVIYDLDNKTNNHDNKYSLSVQEANTGTDNYGNELTTEQKDFFKDSKVTDEDGNLIEVYHGTPNGEFTVFDRSYGNPENDMGIGFYFTNDEGDVDTNYVDGGPDFDAKVEREAERIENVEEISYEEAKEKALKNLYVGGNKITAYLNMTNPAVVGKTRLFSYDDYFSDIDSDLADEAQYYQDEINEYAQEYFDTEDIDSLSEDDMREARDEYLREQGIYDEIVNRYLEDDIENAIDSVNNHLDIWDRDIEELRNILWESVYDGGIGINELKEKLANLSIYDSNSEMANNEAVRLIIESAGYDGIIDNTVSNKFKNMGIDENTTHYIVFNPNQIKNIDNTNPSSNDDIRYQLSNQEEVAPYKGKGITSEQIQKQDLAPIQQQIQELSTAINDLKEAIEPTIEKTDNIAPTERDVMEMVDNEGVRKSVTENQPAKIKKERNAFRRFRDTFEGSFINRNVHQDNLAKETGNMAIKHKADMLSNVMGEVNADIYSSQTNNQGQAIGKGINQLFEEANSQGLGAVLNDFLINYSNIDRYAMGKGSQTPLEVSQRLVRDYIKQYPQLRAWAEDVWQWSKNERQNLVDAGLIDQETANYLEQIYPHYVPYVSDYENADSYFEGVGELKPKGLKRAKGGAGALLSVQDAMARYTYAQKKAVRTNELYSEIVDTLGTIPNFGVDERTDFTDMKDTLYKDSQGQYLTAYRDGKQITTQINAELYNELSKNFENQVKNFEKNMELVLKPIQKINEIRRNILTTWSPTFPVTNAIKDIQDALLNSKYTKDMVANYPSAIKELTTMSTDQVKQFVSLYGSGLTMGEFSQDTMNQKTKNVKFLNKIRQANEIIELAPRYAEFKASLKNGASLQEAMYNAREVTTNFGRGGVITKALNRNGATFLNASVQGFDKFIRNFSGENGAKGVVNSLIKAAVFGVAPALFNHLVFGDDDEEYEALPDYLKDNYYLIKLDDDGDFLRIPKGRMLSIFGSAARRTIEATEGNGFGVKDFLNNAWNQTGVNNPADNNLFAPLFQAFGSKNGNAWYGGDIIPTRLQKSELEEREKYDESTDKFSIWLGDKLNISPMKINYVIDQYTGGIGDLVLPTITEEATSDGNLLAPIKDKFVTNSTTKNKYVSEFYSTKESIKGTSDEAELQRAYLDSISWEMSSLYKEKREIQNDSSLSKKEKFEKSQEIKKQINELAKTGLDGYQNVKVEGNYASVNDDMGYYKNSKGEWKPESQKDIEIASYSGLTDRERSNYYSTKNNIYQIKDKYSDSKDYAGRRKEIINEIINSNIPDQAKIDLYQQTYNDKSADNLISAGVSADNYLRFKAQSFSADKDKNGKSISGSKKQKVFNYINSMDIPFEQKVILAKSEYNTYNEYNRQIINYLNNQDIDYDTMKTILEDLGFKVKGNNISW